MTFELFVSANDLRISQGNLPHWYQPGVTYFVTFRTEDSIPHEAAELWYRRRDDWLRQHQIEPDAPRWQLKFRQLSQIQQHEFSKLFSEESRVS